MPNATNPDRSRTNDTFVVSGPRATDAMGGALRTAFDPRAKLPSEMTDLLARLDSRA